MEQMQIYEHEQFGKIRTLTKDGDIWFVATDICDALDIKNTTDAVKRLDDDERSRFNLGRQGMTNCVNEYGLYNLILASRKPEAKTFKRWITHEVLPNIHKYVLAVPRDKLEVWLNWHREAAGLEEADFKPQE